MLTSKAKTPDRRAPSRRRGLPRLVVLGDLVLDIVIRPDGPLMRGSDVAGTISFRAGGSAANVCRAFAGLGGSATFVGAVGRDGWARRLAASLRRDGVSVRSVTSSQPTARLAALIEAGGERTFVTQRGAANRRRRAQLNVGWLRGADFLHLPAYSLFAQPLAGAAAAAAAAARDAGALLSIDLASRGPLLTYGRDEARRAIAALEPTLILANLDEARALAGRGNLGRLLELAPILVVKEGVAGCRVLWRPAGEDQSAGHVLELDVATQPIATNDTTGAGDAFDAGFLYSLAVQLASSEGRSTTLRRAQTLRRAAVVGHRAAARLLTRPRQELEL